MIDIERETSGFFDIDIPLAGYQHITHTGTRFAELSHTYLLTYHARKENSQANTHHHQSQTQARNSWFREGVILIGLRHHCNGL